MAGKFVGFQILERDAERGQIYPYPATAEDVATQLRAMGWLVAQLDHHAIKDEVNRFMDELINGKSDIEPVGLLSTTATETGG